MHPQVRKFSPGDCPICGMSLEAEVMVAHTDEENSEHKAMRRYFWVALLLTTPVYILEMGNHFFWMNVNGVISTLNALRLKHILL